MDNGTPQLVITACTALGIGGLLREAFLRRKTNAETGNIDADSHLKEAQAESIRVKVANDIMMQVMNLSNAKDAQISTLRTNLDKALGELKDLQTDFNNIRVLLGAHGQWDIQIMALVKQIEPDFPDPPPLWILDKENTDAEPLKEIPKD